MKRCPRAALSIAVSLLAVAVGIAGPTSARGSGAALAGEEQEKPKKSVDAADVYYGDARKWEKPAEVDPDKVYAKIDEYKEIVEKGLKPGDAKYEILMSKASKRFTCAVRKAAKDASYDLVAKLAAVKGVDSVPDITSDVIAKL